MVEVKLHDPSSLNREQWADLQNIYGGALSSTIDRPQAEIDILAGDDDPGRYYDSHIDPNTEVGRRYNFNQLYTNPRVAVATDGNDVIGFAYSANNVSGGGSPEGPQNDSAEARFLRASKRLSIVKNYLWVREMAVMPDYQRQGVAKQLGKTLLEAANDRQPVATYIWPEEIDFMTGALTELGFSGTGTTDVKLFGESGGTTKQVRMQAPNVKSVLKNLNQ